MTGSPTGRQFIRFASLIVADKTGDGLDLSNMEFNFRTNQSTVETPNTAIIRVLNLAQGTASKILGLPVQYGRVILQAGYRDGNRGAIFNGTIKQVKIGRLNQTDTFVDIWAADGDIPYNNATISVTLAPSQTDPKSRLAAIQQAMSMGGTTGGVNSSYAPGIALGPTLPRGKVMYGMARDHMRDLADSLNSEWSIQNGTLTLISQTSYLPGAAVSINSATGMIGTPTQTDNGISITCLLNPSIKVGGVVKIDNASIQAALTNLSYGAVNNISLIAADGTYKVLVVEHDGGTRSNEWYSHLTCLAVNETAAFDVSVKPQGG